jgi:hypothetical protein
MYTFTYTFYFCISQVPQEVNGTLKQGYGEERYEGQS